MMMFYVHANQHIYHVNNFTIYFWVILQKYKYKD